MRKDLSTTPNIMANLIETNAKCGVHTQYVVKVVKVSDDGRFVSVVHCTLEWGADSESETVMINEFDSPVAASPTKPWVVNDVPVEQPYIRGQWAIQTRPRIGDYGILSVFYHDIQSWKDNGGFQAPSAIRIHAIDSCSFRPGLPNHADVSSETVAYPTDDEWELNGNGVKIKLTSPVDKNSESPNKMDVTVGTVQFTITVPKDGTPTINFNAPDGAITVNAKIANVNLTESATLTTPTTTVDGNVSITGTLDVGGAVTASSTLDVTGAITGASTIEGKGIKDTTLPPGVTLGTHTHGSPTPVTPTPTPGS